jgi:hypothetical protein
VLQSVPFGATQRRGENLGGGGIGIRVGRAEKRKGAAKFGDGDMLTFPLRIADHLDKLGLKLGGVFVARHSVFRNFRAVAGLAGPLRRWFLIGRGAADLG